MENDKYMKRAIPFLIRVRNVCVSIACAALLFAGLAWGAHFFLRHLKYEITNDAYVDQYVVPLSVRVSGNIKEVRFREHQKVKKGDLLLTIDDREFRMRVAAAKAALADAIANSEMLESDVEIARHNIEAASAAVEEAKMRHIHLGGDAKRFRELIKSNAVSESAKEGAESDFAANAARIRALEAKKRRTPPSSTPSGKGARASPRRWRCAGRNAANGKRGNQAGRIGQILGCCVHLHFDGKGILYARKRRAESGEPHFARRTLK